MRTKGDMAVVNRGPANGFPEFVPTWMCMPLSKWFITHIYICMYVCVYIYMYITCIYILYVCMYIYIYIRGYSTYNWGYNPFTIRGMPQAWHPPSSAPDVVDDSCRAFTWARAESPRHGGTKSFSRHGWPF